jgi:hypothetical protein
MRPQTFSAIIAISLITVLSRTNVSETVSVSIIRVDVMSD